MSFSVLILTKHGFEAFRASFEKLSETDILHTNFLLCLYSVSTNFV